MEQQQTLKSQTRRAALDPQLEIKQLLSDFAQAVREGNLEKVMSFYGNEIRAFDMMAPLQFTDLESYKKTAWQECFIEAFEFPVNYDLSEQKIFVDGDLAIVTELVHMSGLFKDGKEMQSWLRQTMALRRLAGTWKIVHDHNSAPSGPDGKVLMNLSPDEQNPSSQH